MLTCSSAFSTTASSAACAPTSAATSRMPGGGAVLLQLRVGDRLVLVNDEDIRRVGQWPLSDENLSRVIETLVEARPRAIGIDLYRDLPVQPGTDRFERLIASNEQGFE